MIIVDHESHAVCEIPVNVRGGGSPSPDTHMHTLTTVFDNPICYSIRKETLT